jgi:hypothetical protein
MGAPMEGMSDLGGRPMTPGENMPADQAAAAMGMQNPAPIQQPKLEGPQVAPPSIQAAQDMGLSQAPGYTYLHHLLVRDAVAKGNGEKKDKAKQPGIYTDQEEACKTAISMLGIYSDKNPGGLPIPLHAAKQLFFKNEQPDGRDFAEWRNTVDRGDRALDPKHVRKFVNYDGSLTFEVLNHDKTVQARFTMGTVGDKVIFSPGGYSTFKDTMDKFNQEQGGDSSGGFDAIQAALNGGE